ncbi:MAG: hypothetical protein CME88_04230 [Hirschia sp.]|nr:hypothetical protein [Hirschia sp.]MBF17567.1 hypothetical protein [Hirschia sp.]|tara:strand:+ start:362 stop:850 length:489 start_codon:yes stop_codon:yes gene_type:complete
MRPIPPLALACLALLGACAGNTSPDASQSPANGFDPALASQLGADEYGMRSYVLVTLNTGPNDATLTDAEERATIFRGHFANMKDLAGKGLLAVSGPFMDAAPKRGLYIFNVPTIEEAQALVLTDPAVAAGIFEPEFDKLYASAALMQVNEIHVRVQQTAVE